MEFLVYFNIHMTHPTPSVKTPPDLARRAAPDVFHLGCSHQTAISLGRCSEERLWELHPESADSLIPLQLEVLLFILFRVRNIRVSALLQIPFVM